MPIPRITARPAIALMALVALAGVAVPAVRVLAQPSADRAPDFPPFDGVVEGLRKVVSTTDVSKPLYTLYEDRDSGRLLAELPSGFEGQLLLIAPTVSGGDPQAGVMGGTIYATWRKIGKNLALVEPNLGVRTDGTKEERDSVASLYTGRVIVDTPILTMGPGGGPVIDLGALITQRYSAFFPQQAAYGAGVPGANPRLAALTKAKAFPKNIMAEYEMPAADGRLMKLAYSIGTLEGTPGFKPRTADNRVGYFYNWHQDFAEPNADDVTKRYITRWNLEKADPSLTLSPAKQPVVWYIEHTAPVKYRRFIRDGILAWNEAFERIGILGAMEVYQQDAGTGAHMDIDPEDARYNFFRWNTSDQGYAIGPSRTNPHTGEILDADVVWHQGLTRAVRSMLANLAEDVAQQTMTPETLAFLAEHPSWDPRIRLAEPAQRAELYARHAAGEVLFEAHAHEPHDGSEFTDGFMNSACRMGSMLSMNMGLAAAAFDGGLIETGDGEDLFDGLPESYVGQMIRYIVAHEVGHCIGLQHNFSASTIRTLEEINQPGYDGPIMSSVMEYAAPNINAGDGSVQGPWMQMGVGPYDIWAIAFGYGPESERDAVLAQATVPDHRFGSQLATLGPDPRVNTWDMGAEPLDFARSRMRLVTELRGKLIDSLVDEGDSWARARQRYQQLLGTHFVTLNMAARYLGGSYINAFNKGDADAPEPVTAVPATLQREALAFLIENSFNEEAFGITPELMRHFGKEYWYDPAGISTLLQDPAYTVHDVIGGVQAAALTFVMNPTTLRRVYDNQFRDGRDAFALTELVTTVTDAAWSDTKSASTFQQNLQREHLERLITLALLRDFGSPSLRAISSLARAELTRIKSRVSGAGASAHLTDVRERIDRTLEAAYVVTR